jgi:hypothetical protein
MKDQMARLGGDRRYSFASREVDTSGFLSRVTVQCLITLESLREFARHR